MLRYACAIVCLSFAIVFAGCATPSAPSDTREADIQAVRDVESAWLKSLTAKDLEKFVSYYADDASGLFPGPPILEGKQAIEASLAPVFADPNFSFTMQSLRTEASKGGDMAYSQGTYVQTTTDAKTGKPKTVKGKFVFIYRKQADGSWKAVVDAAVRDPAS